MSRLKKHLKQYNHTWREHIEEALRIQTEDIWDWLIKNKHIADFDTDTKSNYQKKFLQ